MNIQEAIKKYLKLIGRIIPEDHGTYNKFCPTCFYRQGHNMQWCKWCGTKMVVYTEQRVRPEWGAYIMAARTEAERRDRASSFIYHFSSCYNHNGCFKRGEFKFVWYKEDPNCTTPLFCDAIMGHLNGRMT